MARIVHIAAEMAPIAKAGGLGDVILGLDHALVERGHDSVVILPKYDCLDSSLLTELTCTDELKSYYDNSLHCNRIWRAKLYDLPIYLIEPHDPNDMFRRGCLYGCPDDIDRFLYFCRAATGLIQRWQTTGIDTAVVHHHDWHTAAAAALIREVFIPKGLARPRLLLTVHNFQYQGQGEIEALRRAGLDSPHVIDLMTDPHRPDTINLLKGGVAYADAVTTVSPRHAQEVLTPEGGHGLDASLRDAAAKFSGVTNGIDYDYWNPATDTLLPYHFSVRNGTLLGGKKLCKRALQQRLGLACKERTPLVGSVSRLVPQKGIELIKHALFRTLEKEGQFVLLGSCPIPEIYAEFSKLQERFRGHPDVHLHLGYCEELTHCLFGGADVVVVPSLFEPCGLTQLIALRYGALPVVRHTGGLADTIADVDYQERGNGYSFNDPDQEGIHSALDRALACYRDQPERWSRLVASGAEEDHSWRSPTEAYLQLYGFNPTAEHPHSPQEARYS